MGFAVHGLGFILSCKAIFYAVVGVQLKDFFITPTTEFNNGAINCGFSHSEFIVGDFWLITGINCIRLLV